MSEQELPLYSIGSVARLAKLPVGTLRNWELRYGIPKPIQATPRGHRLYTAAEAALACRLAERVMAGVPIRKAAAALSAERDAPTVMAQRLTEAARRLDIVSARRIMADAAALLSAERVCADVILPTLHSLRMETEQESPRLLADEIVVEVVRAWIYSMLLTTTESEQGPLLVLAGGPGERYDLEILLMALFLRLGGMRTLYLGIDPSDKLLHEAMTTQSVALVIMVATVPLVAEQSIALASRLLGTLPPEHPVLAFAGSGFTSQEELSPIVDGQGVYLGATITTVVDGCRKLINTGAARFSVAAR